MGKAPAGGPPGETRRRLVQRRARQFAQAVRKAHPDAVLGTHVYWGLSRGTDALLCFLRSLLRAAGGGEVWIQDTYGLSDPREETAEVRKALGVPRVLVRAGWSFHQPAMAPILKANRKAGKVVVQLPAPHPPRWCYPGMWGTDFFREDAKEL